MTLINNKNFMIPEVIKIICRRLRSNSTKTEIILWNYLKSKQLWYKFLRQSPLYAFTENSWLDRFIIPDFYCKEKKLILEIDWTVHNKEEVYILDKEKEKLFKQRWINILRINNQDIYNNLDEIIRLIKNKLK